MLTVFPSSFCILAVLTNQKKLLPPTMMSRNLRCCAFQLSPECGNFCPVHYARHTDRCAAPVHSYGPLQTVPVRSETMTPCPRSLQRREHGDRGQKADGSRGRESPPLNPRLSEGANPPRLNGQTTERQAPRFFEVECTKASDSVGGTTPALRHFDLVGGASQRQLNDKGT